MARIRTIKPEFFAHEDLYQGEKETGLPLRLAYAGLWTAADREGRFKWKPMQLKTAAMPYDEVDFSHVLDALVTRGFVFRYEVSGVIYGVILSWKRHQFINNKEPQSLIPPPPQNLIDQEVDAIATRRARDFHASLTRGVKEGKGKEGNIEEIKPAKPSARKARGPQQTDIRFHHFVEILHRYWDRFSKPKIRFELWFDAPGGKQLKNILRRHEAFTVEEFTHCVANRARSPGVKHEEPFYLWGGHILEWVGGPKGNGQASKDAERNARNKAEIILGITGQSPSGDAFHSGPAVPERDHGGSDRVLEAESHRPRAAVAGTDT